RTRRRSRPRRTSRRRRARGRPPRTARTRRRRARTPAATVATSPRDDCPCRARGTRGCRSSRSLLPADEQLTLAARGAPYNVTANGTDDAGTAAEDRYSVRPSMPSFVQELAERIHRGMAPVVLGLDPRADALPDAITAPTVPERIVAFYRQVLPVLARHAPVVKPNVAFFEAHGSKGYAAYAATCALA